MSVISTKITPPRQGQSLVRRTRLLGDLKRNIGRNLTLVQAPAGYGKTTILYQLRLELLEQGYLVAWYSLDSDDNEEVAFLEYLTASLQHVLRKKITSLPPQQFSGLGGVHSVKSEISRLLNVIAKTDEKISFILDDFHLIHDPKVATACKMLIEYAPSNLHIAIGTRTSLPFQTTKLFAQGKAVEFNAEDLRFRIDETQSYFEVASQLNLSPLQVYAIQGSTEGWVAGLQLTSLALKRKTISDDLIATIAQQNKTVKNFLAEQVLDAQEKSIRTFLLRSSILSRFNAALCNYVMEIDNAEDVIHQLNEDNLFLFSLSEDDQWFRYHHSFSSFLLSRLQYEHPAEVPGLHLRACEWFSEHGFIPEAIKHAIDANHFDLAKQLLEKHAMALVQQGRTTTLLNFMKKLPGFGQAAPAQLSLAVAWSLILVRRPDEAIAILEQIGNPDPETDPALKVRTEVARLTAMCWQDRPLEAKERIRKLLASGTVEDAWDYGVLNNNLIYASIFDGNLNEAEAAYRALISSDQSLYTTVYSKVLMGNCLKINAHLFDAATLFQDALDLSERKASAQSPAAALAAANLVEILYEWNDLASVQSVLEGRLEIIDETSLNDVLLSVYRPLIRMYSNGNRLEEANELISHTLRMAREQPYGMRLEASILVEELRIFLLQGKIQAAANRLDHLKQFIKSLDLTSDWIRERLRERELLAEAYLNHARGRYGDALKALDALCALAQEWGHEYDRLYYSILRAINLHALGEHEDALTELGRLLQIAESCEMIRSLTDLGEPFRKLLVEILDLKESGQAPESLQCLGTDYLEGLLKVIDADTNLERQADMLGEPDRSGSDSGAPVHLTNRQIEILQLIAQGLSNKEIASSLFIALDTVKWHLKIIYNKLDVSSRTQAIARGKEAGLI